MYIASNIGIAKAAGIDEPFPAVQSYNLLWMLFSPESNQKPRLAPVWEAMAEAYVNRFYRFSLPHRSTPYFQTLFDELNRFAEFREIWKLASQSPNNIGFTQYPYHVTYPNGSVGSWYNTLATTHTSVGGLHLTMNVPANKVAVEKFTEGVSVVPQALFHFKEWLTPEKFPRLNFE